MVLPVSATRTESPEVSVVSEDLIHTLCGNLVNAHEFGNRSSSRIGIPNSQIAVMLRHATVRYRAVRQYHASVDDPDSIIKRTIKVVESPVV